MKALTISQPYASLIASGEKWVENRSWFTPYRGPLAIHAGSGTQYLTKSQLREYPTGVVIAVCRLAACIKFGPHDITEAAVLIQGTTKTVADLMGHEHAEGPWCWILEDVQKLGDHVKCGGHLGLWECTRDMLCEIVRQESLTPSPPV